jgi:hypothetical protein
VLAKEERIRLKAMLEQDRRENSGFGDQLMEMLQTSWAIDKICRGSFKIDMCFRYGDDESIERGEKLCDCGNQMGWRMLERGRQ